MFTYVASASPRGNENIRRVCSHCSGVFYVTFNAQNYRCPPPPPAPRPWAAAPAPCAWGVALCQSRIARDVDPSTD